MSVILTILAALIATGACAYNRSKWRCVSRAFRADSERTIPLTNATTGLSKNRSICGALCAGT